MHIQFEKNYKFGVIILNEAIRVEIKTELFNTKQNIFVCIKGKKDLPIMQQSKPLKISELETKASEIASFLKVPLKGV